MDCGVFIPIANNGWILSTTSPQFMPTFELNRQTVVRAEEVGFDFALSMVKFRGGQGQTEYWDHALDSLSLVSALAASTSRIQIYGAVATPTLHPAMVARAVSTISDVSGGRFGVNIVSGWNKFEQAQMGLWPGDDYYEKRYDYSAEFVEVMRKLWATGRASHQGTYFQLEDCFSQPTPKGPVTILTAGQSDRGIELAAQIADYNFMLGPLDVLKARRERLDAACALTGRSVGAYALFGIIAAETDDEAVALANHFIDGTDWEVIENLDANRVGLQQGSHVFQMWATRGETPIVTLPEDGTAAYVQGACFNAPHLVGSYERIARYLDLTKTYSGVAGVVLTFPEFVSGVGDFGERIMPLMATRSPATAGTA